jgi:hypothetical protein
VITKVADAQPANDIYAALCKGDNLSSGVPRFWLPIVAFVLASLALPTCLTAWNSTGHRVTAAIAWGQMTPEARAEATRLLRAHPGYERDLVSDLPEGYDPDKWAFMSAAAWPDMVRGRDHPMRDQHRSTWHYVNYPYAPDGDARGVAAPVEGWEPGQEPENAIQAIKKARHELADPDVAPAEKAIALCWYLHLVGDLHQPLHAVALVTEEFPEGDRGGNSVRVTYRGSGTNLHSWWDQRLGGYRSGPTIDRVTERTLQENPRAVFAGRDKPDEPEEIAAESLELAKLWVYMGGAVATADAGELPSGYDAASAAIARRRVAQAGYRMGTELTGLLQ